MYGAMAEDVNTSGYGSFLRSGCCGKQRAGAGVDCRHFWIGLTASSRMSPLGKEGRVTSADPKDTFRFEGGRRWQPLLVSLLFAGKTF